MDLETKSRKLEPKTRNLRSRAQDPGHETHILGPKTLDLESRIEDPVLRTQTEDLRSITNV